MCCVCPFCPSVLSVWLPACLPGCLPVCLCFGLFCLAVPSGCSVSLPYALCSLSVLSVLSVCPSVCPSVRPSMCLCVCTHICVCVGELKLHTQSLDWWQTLMKLEASCWNARFTMRLQLPHFLFTPSCSCVVLSLVSRIGGPHTLRFSRSPAVSPEPQHGKPEPKCAELELWTLETTTVSNAKIQVGVSEN